MLKQRVKKLYFLKDKASEIWGENGKDKTKNDAL